MLPPSHIHIFIDDHLGDTVISTGLLQSLRATFPQSRLSANAKNVELLIGLDVLEVNYNPVDRNLPPDTIFIDLRDYVLKRQPQNNDPLRHLLVHQREIAEECLGQNFPKDFRDFAPVIRLSEAELQEAHLIRQSLAGDNPFIWIQSRTSMPEKDWFPGAWEEVQGKLLGCTFLDLSL